MQKKIDLTQLQWFCKPQLSIQNEDKLVIETEPHTRLSSFTQEEPMAAAVYDEGRKQFTLTVKMSYRFKEPKDECGIVIHLNDERWAKFGVKLKNREVAEIFCTRYYRGRRDISMREIGSGIIVLYLQARFEHGKVSFAYSMNGRKFTDFRIIQFVDDEEEANYYLYACSEDNSYFDTTFSNVMLETEEDKEI